MAMQRPHRRTPHDYERLWRGHYVDKNLHDEWLERLNALTCLDLVSICEGHPGRGRQHERPHVNLRLKTEYLSVLLAGWPDHKAKIAASVDEYLHAAETGYEISLSDEFRRFRDLLREVARFTVRVYSRQQHIGAPDPAVAYWFDGIVARVERLDRAIHSLLHA